MWPVSLLYYGEGSSSALERQKCSAKLQVIVNLSSAAVKVSIFLSKTLSQNKADIRIR